MIQRFVFVKLRDDEVATRAELATRLRAELADCGAVDATVGLPADDSAARWDVSIVIGTATLAAWHVLEAQLAVPLAELAARATVVKAWTFES